MTTQQPLSELTARERLLALASPAALHDLAPPGQLPLSPHLARLNLPVSFDDGVVIAEFETDVGTVACAAQEGEFMGGAVGEIHGAKLTGLIRRAITRRHQAIWLLLDSGGVRLHEANLGLIAISECMRAVFDARAAGIPVLALIGGRFGCFGGTGVLAGCCSAIVMGEGARLGMSGAEVIETVHGVEEFDSRDRPAVWQTYGAMPRRLAQDVVRIVDDDVAAFRSAAMAVTKHLLTDRRESERAGPHRQRQLEDRAKTAADAATPRRPQGAQHALLTASQFEAWLASRS